MKERSACLKQNLDPLFTMKPIRKTFLRSAFMLVALASVSQLSAQGTVEDYERAFSVRNRYSWKMKNGDVKAHAIRGTQRLWYSVYDGEKVVYKEVDAADVLEENGN